MIRNNQSFKLIFLSSFILVASLIALEPWSHIDIELDHSQVNPDKAAEEQARQESSDDRTYEFIDSTGHERTFQDGKEVS